MLHRSEQGSRRVFVPATALLALLLTAPAGCADPSHEMEEDEPLDIAEGPAAADLPAPDVEFELAIGKPTGPPTCLGSGPKYRAVEAPLQEEITTYSIELSPEDLALLDAHPFSDDYVPARVVLNGHEFLDAEVRYRGFSARNFPKQNWKVKLGPGDELADEWGYGRDVFNLNAQYTDDTRLREKLSYDIMAMMGALTPRARFVRLEVNGEYRGLYVDVENPRRDFIAFRRLSDRGALYKAADSQAELLPAPEDYVGPFEKKLLESEPFDDLALFIQSVHATATAADGLGMPMESDAFLRYMTGNVVISQSDHIHKNYMLYHDMDATGLWYPVPWDHDLTFGRFYDNQTGGLEGFFSAPLRHDFPIRYGAFTGTGGNPNWGNWIYHRYLTDFDSYEALEHALRETLTGCLTQEAMLARIDHYDVLTREAAESDPWLTPELRDAAMEALRDHVKIRWPWLCQQVNC